MRESWMAERIRQFPPPSVLARRRRFPRGGSRLPRLALRRSRGRPRLPCRHNRYRPLSPDVLMLLGVIFARFHDTDGGEAFGVERRVMPAPSKPVQSVHHHGIKVGHVKIGHPRHVPSEVARRGDANGAGPITKRRLQGERTSGARKRDVDSVLMRGGWVRTNG
jgi:hypothetical protein